MDTRHPDMQGFLYIQVPAWKPSPCGIPYLLTSALPQGVPLLTSHQYGHQSVYKEVPLVHSAQNMPDYKGFRVLSAPDYVRRSATGSDDKTPVP